MKYNSIFYATFVVVVTGLVCITYEVRSINDFSKNNIKKMINDNYTTISAYNYKSAFNIAKLIYYTGVISFMLPIWGYSIKYYATECRTKEKITPIIVICVLFPPMLEWITEPKTQ